MSAFLAGAIFGALFIGSAFVLFVTGSRVNRRETRREILDWMDEGYEAPPIATTRILIRERNYEL